MIIDAATRRALMKKEHDKAYELLEEMALNSKQWQSDQAIPRKAVRVYEIDTISIINAQLAVLTKKLDVSNISAIQIQNPPYDAFAAGQSANERQANNFGFPLTEQANYVNNFQRNNNLYSNMYTPAWRNYPNLGWRANNNNIDRRVNNF